MSNKFEEVKDKILLSDYIRGAYSYKVSGKRLRFNKCPFCDGGDCADIFKKGKHEQFDCKQCGKKGSIIDFYGYENNIDAQTNEGKSQIVNELCNKFGIDNNTNSQEAKQKPSTELLQAQIKSIKQHEDKIKKYDFTDVVDRLHKQLLESPEGMKYFLDRGLSEDTIKRFKLGYEPKGMNEAFKDYPELQNKKIGDSHEKAECYQYFIPTFNDKGECTYILSRRNDILANQKIEEGKINYKVDDFRKLKTKNLTGVPTTIYNFDEVMKNDLIFICEGWCDTLSLENEGYKSVALNSVTGVDKFIDMIQEVEDYQSKTYVIALDNDKSGKEARQKLQDKLQKLKCRVKHLYPEGEGVKDINDMLLNDEKNLLYSIVKIEQEIQEENEKILTQNSCYSHLNSILNKFISNRNKKLLSTGYSKLDKALGGGLYNSLYVVGGISGLGKTSVVLNIVENLAKEEQDVLFISLEMSREELVAKSLSRFVRETVDKRLTPMDYPSQRDIQNGNFDIEAPYFQEGLINYAEASKRIFIKEANFNYNTELIREDIIKHKALRGKAPVVVVDYLQVLPCLKDYGDDKKNIDFNITELKRISREFDTPVIVISSIGRQYYKKPIDFEAFKSSGNIEFTADVVIGLQYSFMADIGNKSDNEIQTMYQEAKARYPREIQTVILKNRNGSIGEYTNFKYEPKYNYFKEV
jgi:replicative DNA helicase